MRSISGTYRIQSKAEMRAETLILQGFKFPTYLLSHQIPPPDDDIENFYWTSSSKVKWMLLCPVASSDRRITFSPKHSFHASTVAEACSQIFLVNPRIHNRDSTLEDHGEPGCAKQCCEAAKTTRQKSYLHIWPNEDLCA